MAVSVPDSTIEEIKARTDLGELVTSYGIALRHAGSSLTACCPFHREKTPSFHVNVAKGFYHCFGCGESGDAISFVQKQEGLPFLDAVRKLAARCGVEIKEEADPEAGRRKRLYALMAELAAFYRRCLVKMRAAQPARDYLKSRDLGEAAQEAFQIGYAPDGAAPMFAWAEKHGFTPEELAAAGVVRLPDRPGDRGYHRFSGRLMFAICDRQGRTVAFSGRQLVASRNSGKYVNSPETAIFKKSSVLYAFDKAAGHIAKSPHREVIVCEGQIDCIRLHLSGFPVAVASQGTAFTAEHVKMLSRVADAAALAFDDDAAGHKAAIRAAALLLAAGMPVRVVSLPDGDDPDSFLRRHPPEAFQKRLDEAESVVRFQCRVERAKERAPDSLDAVSRISKAVLATISQCPNAVLRASMIGEAASLLKLPSAALEEELSKLSLPVRASTPPLDDPGDAREDDPADGPVAAADAPETPEPAIEEHVLPPPPREMSLMAFLMAHEDDAPLAEAVLDMLPPGVFAHAFTAGFVRVWHEAATSGEDRLSPWAAALQGDARHWFDAILLDAGKVQASSLAPGEILQDFVRALWIAALERRRGLIDASALDDTTLAERLTLTTDLKRLGQLDWPAVQDKIRDLKKGLQQWT